MVSAGFNQPVNEKAKRDCFEEDAKPCSDTLNSVELKGPFFCGPGSFLKAFTQDRLWRSTGFFDIARRKPIDSRHVIWASQLALWRIAFESMRFKNGRDETGKYDKKIKKRLTRSHAATPRPIDGYGLASSRKPLFLNEITCCHIHMEQATNTGRMSGISYDTKPESKNPAVIRPG